MNDYRKYINALRQCAKEHEKDFTGTGCIRVSNLCNDTADLLESLEAEPVRHGHWKPFDEDEYTCSVCGNIFVTMDGEHPLSNGFKYCPFCGAKMDERKE